MSEPAADDLLATLLAAKPRRHTTDGQHLLPLLGIVRAVTDIGWRPAGSAAESRTADYLQSVWDAADVWHWRDTFPLTPRPDYTLPLLAALSVGVIGALYVSLWAAIAVAAVAVAVAYRSVLGDTPATLRSPTAERQSHNVIAIRKSRRTTLRRVVVLAPLDTSPPPVPNTQPRTHLIVATVVFTVLVLTQVNPLLALTGLPAVTLPVLWLLVAGSCYFLVSVLLALRAPLVVRSPGAINHAGALAVLAATFDGVADLAHTEVWAVGLGATRYDAGARDLLQRYPFDYATTFFIGLAGLGRGTLAYALYQHYDRGRAVDALLVEMASQLHADAVIEPRISQAPVVITPLLRRQCRAIEVTCLDHTGLTPLRGSPHDSVVAVNPQILERAVHVTTTMVRSIDALSLSPTRLNRKET